MTRIVHGRTVITNYPLGSLRNEEKRDWDLKVRRLRINEIPIDIKADSPGGDYSVQATLRLRGLYETMRFLAKGLGPEVEYQVGPDPRTGIIAEQLAAAEIKPAGTLLLHSGDSPPSNAFVSTKHKGKYYWLTHAEQSPIPLESWNRGAFAMLHTMYQLSVSEAVTKPLRPRLPSRSNVSSQFPVAGSTFCALDRQSSRPKTCGLDCRNWRAPPFSFLASLGDA